MRSLLLAPLLTLAGCQPAQVTLGVPPGFYPSALAHDPVNDRFFVGSYATGAIALVRPDGTRLGVLRPEDASHPIVQLSYEARDKRLWALTQSELEAIDLGALPVRRHVIVRAAPGERFADLAAAGGRLAFLLEATGGTIVAVDAERGTRRALAELPGGGGEGALALLPDRSALIVAGGGQLWRVSTGTGMVEEIAVDTSVPHVSQLISGGGDTTALRVVALRGRANEIVTLYLTPDARRAVVDRESRERFDTPFHGVLEGRDVVVLLGRLRHHPSLGGDGRPNLPPPPRDLRSGPVEPRAPRGVAAACRRGTGTLTPSGPEVRHASPPLQAGRRLHPPAILRQPRRRRARRGGPGCGGDAADGGLGQHLRDDVRPAAHATGRGLSRAHLRAAP